MTRSDTSASSKATPNTVGVDEGRFEALMGRLLFPADRTSIPPVRPWGMRCSDCEKLKSESERARSAYLEILRMSESDRQRQEKRNVPDIWDFIVEVAVKARNDAQRAFEEHGAKHKPWMRSVLFLALLDSDVWEFADELLSAF